MQTIVIFIEHHLTLVGRGSIKFHKCKWLKKGVIDTEKIVQDCDTRFSIDYGSYNKPKYKAKIGGVPVVLDGASCKDFDNRFDICKAQ